MYLQGQWHVLQRLTCGLIAVIRESFETENGGDMNRAVSTLTALLFALALAAPALAQTAGSPHSSASASPPSAKSPVKVATVGGRITRLDTRARTFSINKGGGHTVDLKAGETVNMNLLKRGGRYVVTYSGDVALSVQATRNVR